MTRPFPRKWSAHTEQAERAQSRSTKERTKLLWPAAKNSRDLGSSDAVADRSIALAIETNLIDARGRCNGEDVCESLRTCGGEDVAHAVSWALRGRANVTVCGHRVRRISRRKAWTAHADSRRGSATLGSIAAIDRSELKTRYTQ